MLCDLSNCQEGLQKLLNEKKVSTLKTVCEKSRESQNTVRFNQNAKL